MKVKKDNSNSQISKKDLEKLVADPSVISLTTSIDASGNLQFTTTSATGTGQSLISTVPYYGASTGFSSSTIDLSHPSYLVLDFMAKITCHNLRNASMKRRVDDINFFLAELPKEVFGYDYFNIVKTIVTNLKMPASFLIEHSDTYTLAELEACQLYDFSSKEYSAVQLFYNINKKQ